MKIRSDEKVLNPDKIADVDVLLRKLMVREILGIQRPVYIFIGAGTTEAYHRDYSHDRELHRLISWFKLKEWPLSNIIAVDVDESICNEWNCLGIKCFNADWQDIFYMKKHILPYIDSIAGKFGTRRILYANTHGSREDVSFYDSWIKMFKPSYFLGLYATRGAFTSEDIVQHVCGYENYKPIDLGLLSKNEHKGIIGYRAICMAVLEKTGVARLEKQ